MLLSCRLAAVLAAAPKSKNAKVTLVYQRELPNFPDESIKGVLVEYGPVVSPPFKRANFGKRLGQR